MRQTLLHKIFRIILIVLIVPTSILALTFSGAAVAGQTGTPTAPVQPMESGQVVSIAEDGMSLVIQSGSMETSTITVDQNTEYEKSNINPATLTAILDLVESFMGQGRGPTDAFTAIILSQFRQPATFDDIAVGDIIAVDNPAVSPVEHISIIKVPNVRGTVTAISSDSITIKTFEGEEVTLNWDISTRFLLKGITSIETGLFASVIYDEADNLSLIAVISAPTGTLPPSTASPTPTTASSVIQGASGMK